MDQNVCMWDKTACSANFSLEGKIHLCEGKKMAFRGTKCVSIGQNIPVTKPTCETTCTPVGQNSPVGQMSAFRANCPSSCRLWPSYHERNHGQVLHLVPSTRHSLTNKQTNKQTSKLKKINGLTIHLIFFHFSFFFFFFHRFSQFNCCLSVVL